MVLEYQCPSCGAKMKFDAKLQKMICEYCGAIKEVSEVEQEQEQQQQKPEPVEVKQYICPSCGAEIITDEHTTATFCSFCQSPTLMEDRILADMPKYVIPFQFDKKHAKEIYREWTKKGLLTPSGFHKEATIEKITGIYVPFWLYDYQAEIELLAEGKKVRTERHGDTEYVHTDHFQVMRHLRTEYEKIPADASEAMDDATMDCLEPYDYKKLMEFQMPFLSGFFAEKYNYTDEQLEDRIANRVNSYIYQAAMDSIKGYTSVDVRNKNIQMKKETAEYAMLPVWMLNYQYKDKMYSFAINGQTGRFVGKLPLSYAKVAGCFSGIFLGITILLRVIGGLLG